MFFATDDLAIIVTCFIVKGYTGTRIAREFPNKKWNYQSISRVLAKYRHTDTTGLKNGSRRPVIVLTDEKTGWSWTLLAFISHKMINQELTTASVKPPVSLACHGDRYSSCWRGAASIRSKECEHQQWMSRDWQSRSTSTRFSITSCLEIVLHSENQSILFLVKHVTITTKSSFAKTIFSLLFKCVIYIIRVLTRITSSNGIQWCH